MKKVLQQLINKICLVYLDDVIIFSEDFEGLIKQVGTGFLLVVVREFKTKSEEMFFSEKEN